MKLKVTFEFEFDPTLSQDDMDENIYIIEGWAEHDADAFMEIPGGFTEVSVGYEFIEDSSNGKIAVSKTANVGSIPTSSAK